MEKIWIITIDEVCDYENFLNAPRAYRNEKDAREALQTFKKGLQEDYAEDIEDGYIFYDEHDNSAEVYGDDYSREHYTVILHCVDLQ